VDIDARADHRRVTSVDNLAEDDAAARHALRWTRLRLRRGGEQNGTADDDDRRAG
jgi:hypothetical protein